MNIKTNVIYCGDNLEKLRILPDNCIDLIYADPPFFSNRHYEIIWNDGAEIRAFEDRWQGGIAHYISWMKPKLRECYRVLKDTGSMYLHCDWHANAHLRIIMDNIFGDNNFRNEIIWCYERAHPASKQFKKVHDNIFFYSKSQQNVFNPLYIAGSYGMTKRPSFKRPDGTVWEAKHEGKLCPDYWTDIPSFGTNMSSKERVGYPTQKPEALLKRIIEASSNQGDIVLDPFCGCGTTISVANQLQRKWIGIDVSPTACRMMKDRLTKIGAEVEIIGAPTTLDQMKAMTPFDFQAWIISKLNGTPSRTKSNDKGIDGWTFMTNLPIQIKQSESIGRNVVDNFYAAMQREGSSEGYIYAFSFGKGAYEASAEFEQGDNSKIIHLIKVEELQ